MNTDILKNQIKSQLISWRLPLLVVIGILLTFLEFKMTNSWKTIGSNNFLHYVIGFDSISKVVELYLMLLPFIASLVGGTLYGQERQSGRLKFVQARVTHSVYVRTTTLASFILGVIAALVPLLVDLIFAVAYLPHMQTIAPTDNYAIFTTGFWGYSIFARSQLLMLLIALMLLAVFGGLMAVFATTVTYFVNLRYVELLLPFLTMFAWYLVSSIIGVPEWGHLVFLDFAISDSFPHVWLSIVVVYLVLTIAEGLCLWREEVRDGLA